jgi:hypothetical protein
MLVSIGFGGRVVGISCQVQHTDNGPSGIAVADFNRDSRLDLIVCNDASNNVSVYLGNGDGISASHQFSTGRPSKGIFIEFYRALRSRSPKSQRLQS